MVEEAKEGEEKSGRSTTYRSDKVHYLLLLLSCLSILLRDFSSSSILVPRAEFARCPHTSSHSWGEGRTTLPLARSMKISRTIVYSLLFTQSLPAASSRRKSPLPLPPSLFFFFFGLLPSFCNRSRASPFLSGAWPLSVAPQPTK